MQDDATELLRSLRGEGRHDSSGNIMVDRDRAREWALRMAKKTTLQQLLLMLVRIAYSGGADSFQIEARTREWEVTFDGPTLPPELCRDLPSGKNVRESDPFRHLARVINGGLSQCKEIVFNGWRYRHHGRKPKRVGGPPPRGNHLRLGFAGTWADTLGKLLGRRGGLDEVSAQTVRDLMRDRCGYGRMQVEINGQRLTPAPLPQPPDKTWYVDGVPGVSVPPVPGALRYVELNVNWGLTAWALAAALLEGGPAPPGRALLVHQGVAHAIELPQCPSLIALAHCDSLHLDLSARQLVQNSLYRDVLLDVKALWEGIRKHLTSRPPRN